MAALVVTFSAGAEASGPGNLEAGSPRQSLPVFVLRTFLPSYFSPYVEYSIMWSWRLVLRASTVGTALELHIISWHHSLSSHRIKLRSVRHLLRRCRPLRR